jgi:hypothetical protein
MTILGAFVSCNGMLASSREELEDALAHMSFLTYLSLHAAARQAARMAKRRDQIATFLCCLASGSGDVASPPPTWRALNHAALTTDAVDWAPMPGAQNS